MQKVLTMLTYFGFDVNVVLPPAEGGEQHREGDGPDVHHVGAFLLHLQDRPHEEARHLEDQCQDVHEDLQE